MATLIELTRHEAGIIVYGDNSVMVCNWAFCDDGQRPVLFAGGLQPLDCPELLGDSEDLRRSIPRERISDVRAALPGTLSLDEDTLEIQTDMDIVYDALYDLPALFGYQLNPDYTMAYRDDEGNLIPASGVVYTFPEFTLIVPDEWN